MLRKALIIIGLLFILLLTFSKAIQAACFVNEGPISFCTAPGTQGGCSCGTCWKSWADGKCNYNGDPGGENIVFEGYNCTAHECDGNPCELCGGPPAPTDTPTPTPTPTLAPVSGLVGTCSVFGGPISMSWQYSGTGNAYQLNRTFTSGSFTDPRTPLATIAPLTTKNYTDTRVTSSNELFVGPYVYSVRACYDPANSATCGAYSNNLTINCPTPPTSHELCGNMHIPARPHHYQLEQLKPLAGHCRNHQASCKKYWHLGLSICRRFG